MELEWNWNGIGIIGMELEWNWNNWNEIGMESENVGEKCMGL